jgi:hypothetical protein
MSMSNYLKMPKKPQVLALLELGWSCRRIEAETGVWRETVSGYDRARGANAAKRSPARRRARGSPRQRIARPITEKLDGCLSLLRIWQDLVEEYGYGASYESVKRFVRTIAPARRAVGVFHCPRLDNRCAIPTSVHRHHCLNDRREIFRYGPAPRASRSVGLGAHQK